MSNDTPPPSDFERMMGEVREGSGRDVEFMVTPLTAEELMEGIERLGLRNPGDELPERAGGAGTSEWEDRVFEVERLRVEIEGLERRLEVLVAAVREHLDDRELNHPAPGLVAALRACGREWG